MEDKIIFKMPCKLYHWQVPPVKDWAGGKCGELRIQSYCDGEKTQIVFIPCIGESSTMYYCSDIAEGKGGIRAWIHKAMAAEPNHFNQKAIVFGKAASRSYVDKKGKAIRTAWAARFEEAWMSSSFSFILNRLIEADGNYKAFSKEQNVRSLYHPELESEDDADDDGPSKDLGEENAENGEEESDVEEDVLDKYGITFKETEGIGRNAFRPYGPSDDEYESDEVAETQDLHCNAFRRYGPSDDEYESDEVAETQDLH
jgi:hypothetical protein